MERSVGEEGTMYISEGYGLILQQALP